MDPTIQVNIREYISMNFTIKYSLNVKSCNIYMNVWDIANKNEFGMPTVRFFNTIFHLRRINAKLMMNS